MAEQDLSILYIDDDAGLVRLVQKGLGRHGYKVTGASTIEEGLSALDRGGIDAVALDHYLTTGTGLEFLFALKGRRDTQPPVVYVTASGEVSVAVEALKAGAADYVPKVVGEEFLELLRRAIDQSVKRARLEQERLQAEQAIREARDRAEVLLHEVNHRVANSLTLVGALVRMQANLIEDERAREAIEQLQARIAAIAGVHRRLYTSEDVRSVELVGYLGSLLKELADTVQSPGISVRLDAVETAQVPTDKAVSIGVMITELVTNAMKYAYPAGGGEIRVGLKRVGPDRLRLAVEDDGVGCGDTAAPQGTGVGSRVIAAMARALGSSVDYGKGPGCRASIEFNA
jgi:two-component sensor histidine kinase/CheY-like chemotaxis protein